MAEDTTKPPTSPSAPAPNPAASPMPPGTGKADDIKAEAPEGTDTSGTERTPSAQELDNEARLSGDYVSPTASPDVLRYAEQPDYGPDKDGFIGVSPEYRNYANDTDKPGAAEGGVEAELEQLHLDNISGEPRETDESVKEAYGVVTRGTQLGSDVKS